MERRPQGIFYVRIDRKFFFSSLDGKTVFEIVLNERKKFSGMEILLHELNEFICTVVQEERKG